MDLTQMLLRVAARRPHVLVVAAVGGAAARLAVEAAVAQRGWPTATGPADADLLVVAGSPGPELAAVIERVWRQVPEPRARVAVPEPVDVDRKLTAATELLADHEHQAAPPLGDEAGRAGSPTDAAGPGHQGHLEHEGETEREGGTGHDGHAEPGDAQEHGDDDHSAHHGHDHGDGHDGRPDHRTPPGQEGHGGNHGHHGHHGHGGGGMELPGGLPMADLAEDRDGLMLDRLHVPLGPVLPDWPAGLVVRVTLQGDVIQEAAAQVLDAVPGSSFWQRTGNPAARELDGLARFLGVAGWADAAETARRLRDALLAGVSTGEIAGSVAALARRVRRSRTLRWLIRGIPAGATDVAALLDRRLTAVEAGVATAGGASVARPAVEEVAGFLVGAEFAAARLIVAALDPDTEAAPARSDVRHG